MAPIRARPHQWLNHQRPGAGMPPGSPVGAVLSLSTKSKGGEWVEVGDDMWGLRVGINKLRLR
jgi:hypothetical protein